MAFHSNQQHSQIKYLIVSYTHINIPLLLTDTKIERDKKNLERGFRRTKTVNGVIGDPINEYQYRQDNQIHQGS